ncbi:MAG: type II toxin-antitoxin system RelE/ParE family toxin [Thaumarchaeota archaeon]|nr:type II toxin-antitoxin system RelE/ParE family toxin [Nitrososphaerota archaeon]
MPNIVKRPLAKKDMKGIWKYIADDSADRATQFLRLLESKMEILANTPLMGRACDELMPSLRFFPVGNYLIFYLPIEGGIEVARVLHGAQDIQRYFPDMTLQ